LNEGGINLPVFFDNLQSIDFVLQCIAAVGAVSVPLLEEGFRLKLLEEAERSHYQPEEEVVGSGENIVRQQMASCEVFPRESLYLQLQQSFQGWLGRHLAALPEYPFATPLFFDSASLQRYEPGSIGITPHRDRWRYINLVCIFIIAGSGRFYVCADRSGRDSVEIEANPGNAILMRAPGFLGSDFRPFHYVADIKDRRYSFGLRQLREKGV